MKKTLAILIAAIMIVAAFSACSSKKAAGKYTLKTINGKTPYEYFTEEASKEGLDVATLLAFMGLSEDKLNEFVVINLEEDGKAKAQVFGEEAEEGTWELKKSNTVTITIGDETNEYEYKNGTLTVEDDGVTYVLERAK